MFAVRYEARPRPARLKGRPASVAARWCPPTSMTAGLLAFLCAGRGLPQVFARKRHGSGARHFRADGVCSESQTLLTQDGDA